MTTLLLVWFCLNVFAWVWYDQSPVSAAVAALTLAETFVKQERSSVTTLTKKTARWRKDPASEGQLNVLRRRRIPFTPTITKGEASALIDLANARRSG